MRLQPLPFLAAAIVFLVFSATGFALSAGADRGAVIEELGKPASAVKLGNREILTYPKKIRIELVDGKVEHVEGIQLEEDIPARPAAVDLPKPEPPPIPAPATTVPSPKSPGKSVPPKPDRRGKADATDLPTFPLDDDAPSAPRHKDDHAGILAHGIIAVIAWVLVHVLVTCLLLKIAFKIWEQDALLTGFLAIAGIDAGLRFILEVAGRWTYGLTQTDLIQSGVCALVMVFTIRRFCFNKDWFVAVRAAMIVKGGWYLIWMLASVALVRLVMH